MAMFHDRPIVAQAQRSSQVPSHCPNTGIPAGTPIGFPRVRLLAERLFLLRHWLRLMTQCSRTASIARQNGQISEDAPINILARQLWNEIVFITRELDRLDVLTDKSSLCFSGIQILVGFTYSLVCWGDFIYHIACLLNWLTLPTVCWFE